MKKLFALRGACQCENSIDDICTQIGLMYDDLISHNSLNKNDIVSIIFSVTKDLTAVNPATALRKYIRGSAKGKDNEEGSSYALFSAQEPECVNSVERIVRVIIHCYMEEDVKPRHVYRNGAEVLRPDRAK